MASIAKDLPAAPDPHVGHAFGPFSERYQTAIDDPRLPKNVTRYQQNWSNSRTPAVREIEFDTLRDQLKAVKARVVERIDGYIAEFKANAEKAGTKVHLATDAEDANRIIYEIFQRHGATKVSKSKSMVSEEVELNHYLEA